MTTDELSNRALNRATLERQLLLHRSDLDVIDAVTHLIGLQAQEPLNPYVALWSRLADFEPESFSQLLTDRAVVRIVVMRGTIHAVTAADCLTLRPLMQPVLDRELLIHRDVAPALVGVDPEPVLAFARALLAERPLTLKELRAAFGAEFPDHDASALVYLCRNRLAFVQTPPRGLWRQSAQIRATTAEAWLGRSVDPNPSIDDVVLRYLGAFGPATTADVAVWCRLTGLAEVLERLRPQLRTFRDPAGREVFDLPDAPRPGPDTVAPPRFLPEYDNALLSHADRSRFHHEHAHLELRPGAVRGTLIHDGLVAATWAVHRDRDDGSATLDITPGVRLAKRAQSAIVAEGRRFLRFHEASASSRDVRVLAADSHGSRV